MPFAAYSEIPNTISPPVCNFCPAYAYLLQDALTDV